MKLNPDCMREILLAIENCKYGEMLNFSQIVSQLPDYSKEDISYSCEKPYEAGFIDAVSKNYMRGDCPIIKVKNITYDGHQFLDNIREEDNWQKTKDIAKSVGSVSIPTLMQIATNVISSVVQSKFGL